jgi:exonuclease 3'-5' domain-containing protein 2
VPTNQKLWNPRQGIVFSPSESPVLYPQIDFARHNHVSASASSLKDQESEILSRLQAEATPPTRQTGCDGRESLRQRTPLRARPVEAPQAAQEAISVASANKGTDVAENTETATVEVEPPRTDLDYKICANAFQAAGKAPAGSPESFWSYTLYRGPEEDGVPKKVKVHYCKSKHTMERVCQYFLGEGVIGFDMEWVPEANKQQGVRKNVSLIQIASPSRIALFHVALFPKSDDFVAPTFREIMEDPNVSKVGVAIKADCTRLSNFLGVATRGIFELSHLYKLVKYSSSGQVELVNKRLVPLATQVQEYLRLPMFKGQDVRSSNWALPLSMDQIVCE